MLPFRRLQPFSREKLTSFVERMSWDIKDNVLRVNWLVDRVCEGLTLQVSSRALLLQCAEMAGGFSTRHPDYSKLGGRIYATFLHGETMKSFTEYGVTYGTGEDAILDSDILRLCNKFGPELDDAVMHSRDFTFTYSAIHSMAHSYLIRAGDRIVERPQFLYLRVALSIHKDDLDMVLRTYDALSRRLFTFATPTLMNAGTRRAYFASCFLYTPDPTGPVELLQSANDLDRFWLADGGIGLSLGAVPARRAGPSKQPGVLPLMRVYDEHAECTSLWRSSRPSAATVYLPIWHADVRRFIICRTSRAARHEHVRRLFPGLFIPDIFMQRLEKDEEWRVFDPVDVPDLLTTFGDVFTTSYQQYEASVEALAVMPARELWDAICRAQAESGGPFIMYRDAINAKNNEAHLGVINGSNLCTEIVQYSDPNHIAVCTLASVAVSRFAVRDGAYDLRGLHEVTMLAVRGADSLINEADYPTRDSYLSAINTRALGVGAQGLADAFMISGFAFGSPEARALNLKIFETIYHAAYQSSCELGRLYGSYPFFRDSPACSGVLQPDMWPKPPMPGVCNFDNIRQSISLYGLRNSMLTAQMPTASTARLLGNFDGVEPYTSNVLVHRVLSGDYTEVNSWLVRDLEQRGLWTDDVRGMLLNSHGSIQGIAQIPSDLKEIYRTAWEIDPLVVVDLAADRGRFIDQTQSMSLNVVNPTTDDLMRIQLHAWRRGLKTGLYYLRTQAPMYPQPYGVGRMSTGRARLGEGFNSQDKLAGALEPQTAVDAVSADSDELRTEKPSLLALPEDVVEGIRSSATDEAAVEGAGTSTCVGLTAEDASSSSVVDLVVSCAAVLESEEDMVVCEGCSA